MTAQRSFRYKRSAAGQAIGLPLIVLALLVILTIGLFAFEIARTAVARDQLRSATEAAALAGAATLAGSSSTDVPQTQGNAISAAKKVFRQNDVFGDLLSNAEEAAGTPGARQAFLKFRFLDPNSNNAEVPPGDPRGKAMEVSAQYGLPALTGAAIGLGNAPVPISAKASGGVGELDVVLCFDCSASMRLHTKGTTVRRTWDASAEKIQHVILGQSSASLSGGIRPQQLFPNVPLRGANDAAPPGNFPPGTAPNNGLTDVVTNIDENGSFAGLSEGGFDFPSVAVLVEAQRGTLENEAVFQSSQAATALQGVVTPKAGYQAKYFELARKHTHPWAEAEDAAREFFTLMNNNTRAHFGFVAFQQQVGQDENTSFQERNVGPQYTAGGTGTFPLPAISLNKTQGQSNFQQVSQALSGVVPFGGTNIGGSIERAVRMFDTQSRPNAKRAIIVFTDGTPTVGGPLSGSPINNCQLAAQLAKLKGIAIFTVGLALQPSEQAQQAQVLNMITNTAGNGGRFFQVSSASNLKGAFAGIARNLTQIVQ